VAKSYAQSKQQIVVQLALPQVKHSRAEANHVITIIIISIVISILSIVIIYFMPAN